MKKQLVIIGIVTILVTVGLSGCETEVKDTDGNGYSNDIDAFPNNNTEWLDTDKDGYGDNSDKFPTDTNLHERIDIMSTIGVYFPNHQYSSGFNVYNDSKYVVVNWMVMYSLYVDEFQEISFSVRKPPENKFIFYYYNMSNNSIRFPVNSSNWGYWSYEFTIGNVTQNITINHEIFILK